jgi:hypothetical protein
MMMAMPIDQSYSAVDEIVNQRLDSIVNEMKD